MSTVTRSTTEAAKVLVVDDDRVIRTILVKLLQKEGYQVVEAETGGTALTQYQQFLPDLVLLDAQMPGLDGFGCCKKIRQMAFGEHVPILMVTGLEDDDSVVRAFHSGATDYVTKPIRPSVVVGRARYLIRAAQDRKALVQSEERYRSLVTNLQEVVFQLDEAGNLTFLNPVWHKFTGYSAEDSLGKPFVEFLHPAERKLYWQQFRRACKSSTQCYQHRSRCVTRSGDWLWVEMQLCANLDATGAVQGIAGRLTNISDRTRREQYRRLEYAVMRAMTNHANVQVMMSHILQIVCGNLNVELGEFWQLDSSGQLRCTQTWHLKTEQLTDFAKTTQALQTRQFDAEAGVAGKIWSTGAALWTDKLNEHVHQSRQEAVRQAGFRLVLGCPVSHGDENLGVLIFFSQDARPASQDLLRGLTILANQISQHILRQRAERELQRQNQILQLELQRAADYVASLLPAPHQVYRSQNKQASIAIHTQFQPSSQLGGDAFDYYWLDPDHLAFYILDVAGHGIKAALLSVSVLNILRKQSLNHADFYQPATVVAALNRIFQMNDNGEDYFTLWYGVYCSSKQHLTFASAGHPPSVLISPCESQAKISHLDSDGIAVGMLPDFPFASGQCVIPPHSRLFLFSDGAYEVIKEDGQPLLSFEGWAHLLKQYWHSGQDDLSILMNQVHRINGNKALQDDASVMEIRFS
ncbi:SpoIIE family protein phosphatase [Nodosilinea sp. LEGE 06152]|uniref:SpoIIE family protein phosphatase n=1 Tax=Nodosilinea sp. LEGE 06152 TaxID=2777966 RepID=UPI00187E44E6|nr:SpoIIE family protein phosphatase [Nodosilinea sp. LEGE 06152]MBE9157092.1 SpoIIE family protein phosphatase [Nodosilinea sp. LEGE 06152]